MGLKLLSIRFVTSAYITYPSELTFDGRNTAQPAGTAILHTDSAARLQLQDTPS